MVTTPAVRRQRDSNAWFGSLRASEGRAAARNVHANRLGKRRMPNHNHHAVDRDWDVHAASYNEQIDGLEPELRKATMALLASARIGPGMRVLDVACGPGHTTAAATEAGADALGIDASAQMIRHASTRFPHSRFEVGDMMRPPAGPWDAIVCRLGGHHADQRWIAAAAAALRSGGRLAIAETDAIDEAARAKNMKPPQEWARIMQAAGLLDVRMLKPMQTSTASPPARGMLGQPVAMPTSPPKAPCT